MSSALPRKPPSARGWLRPHSHRPAPSTVKSPTKKRSCGEASEIKLVTTERPRWPSATGARVVGSTVSQICVSAIRWVATVGLFFLTSGLYYWCFDYYYKRQGNLHHSCFGYDRHDQLKSKYRLAMAECSDRPCSIRRNSKSPYVDAEALTPTTGALQSPNASDQDPNGLVAPATVVDHPKPPPRAEKIELTIDSLQNYELLKPIREWIAYH